MKVYLVYKDNGQDYGDWEEEVIKIFSTKLKAQKYANNERRKKENQETVFQNKIIFRIKEMIVEE